MIGDVYGPLICSLQRVAVIHLFNARFKELKGDVFGAREAFLHCEMESDSNFVENITVKANLERRLVFYHLERNIKLSIYIV